MAAAPSDEVQTNVPRFLTVNASELLERMAYYGVISVAALYLDSIGYGKGAIGAMLGVLLPLPYVVSMVAGPLATKFGYKPIMLLAFLGYAAGFALIGSFESTPIIVGGIVLVGVGAGMFKPLATAAVAYTTSLKHRSFGYSVYYMGINVGGFIGPLLMGLFDDNYRLAFLLGAGIILVDAVVVLILFRNPLPPQRSTRIGASFATLGEVLENKRFLVLLGILSGFWLLYSMSLSFLTIYLQSYVDLPSWFKENYQVSLESFYIVLISIPLGAFASRRDGLRMMVAGMAFLVLSFVLIGLFSNFWVYVAGVLVFAIGEVLVYPGFLSYVSRIAPRERVAVYQGYGFLPIFVGFLLGPFIGGPLYEVLVDHRDRPGLFWMVMDCFGILALAALLAYTRYLRLHPAAGTGPVVAQPAAMQPLRFSERRATPLLALLLVPMLLLTGLAVGKVSAIGDVDAPPVTKGLVQRELAALSGSSGQQQEARAELAIPAEALGNVTLALRWTDEPAQDLATNNPDQLQLIVRDGNRELARGDAYNGAGGDGEVHVSFASPGATTLTLVVRVMVAGDQVVAAPLASLILSEDTGNAWTIQPTIEVADPESS